MTFMHLFARLVLEDLESTRKELVTSFEKLTPEQWKRKIPGGEMDVRTLGQHILSDSKRLSILAPIIGMQDLFPVPPTDAQYSCIWGSEKRLLSPENILAKSRYERNKLRTLLAFVSDRKQARLLYESNFQTGWHDRMHLFDLAQALEVDCQQMSASNIQAFVGEFAETIDVLPFLYDVDGVRLDELAESNQAYRQELRLLTSGRFIDAIHRILGRDTHLHRLKGNVTVIQHIQYVHCLHNDLIEHITDIAESRLQEPIDGKSTANRLMKLARSFRSTMSLFKKISLRDSWARQASL